MAKTRSKFFRAFVEGNTISDGRKIDAKMIDDMVATFNAETYTPRCNVEHIAGYSPEPPFNGYGDVVAVKAQDDEFTIAGKTEKRRALYCQVDANDQLIGLQKRDQKPFCSVEITDSYAGSGKTGLVGLAFTDTPASIGTQRLQFSRVANTAFTSDERVAPEFEAAPVDAGGISAAIAAGFAKVAAAFGKAPEPPKDPATPPVTPPVAANDNAFDPAAFATQIGEQVASAIGAAVTPLNEAVAAIRGDFSKLKSDVEKTPAPSGFSRQLATGGDGKTAILADF